MILKNIKYYFKLLRQSKFFYQRGNEEKEDEILSLLDRIWYKILSQEEREFITKINSNNINPIDENITKIYRNVKKQN